VYSINLIRQQQQVYRTRNAIIYGKQYIVMGIAEIEEDQRREEDTKERKKRRPSNI
jgi:hypothetical protein